VHRPEKGDKKVWVYHLLWGRIAGRVEEATRSGKVHYVTFPSGDGKYGCGLYGLDELESRQEPRPVDGVRRSEAVRPRGRVH